jgi:hypothetical protein
MQPGQGSSHVAGLGCSKAADVEGANAQSACTETLGSRARAPSHLPAAPACHRTLWLSCSLPPSAGRCRCCNLLLCQSSSRWLWLRLRALRCRRLRLWPHQWTRHASTKGLQLGMEGAWHVSPGGHSTAPHIAQAHGITVPISVPHTEHKGLLLLRHERGNPKPRLASEAAFHHAPCQCRGWVLDMQFSLGGSPVIAGAAQVQCGKPVVGCACITAGGWQWVACIQHHGPPAKLVAQRCAHKAVVLHNRLLISPGHRCQSHFSGPLLVECIAGITQPHRTAHSQCSESITHS